MLLVVFFLFLKASCTYHIIVPPLTVTSPGAFNASERSQIVQLRGSAENLDVKFYKSIRYVTIATSGTLPWQYQVRYHGNIRYVTMAASGTLPWQHQVCCHGNIRYITMATSEGVLP